MSEFAFGRFDLTHDQSMSRAELAAGYLPVLRLTAPEIRMALDFPNDSEILHEWLGTNGGRIVCDNLAEGSEHAGDATWRQGSVMMPDDSVGKRFEYRATPPGLGSKAFFGTLGWLAGEQIQPRGFLGGRIVPESNY